MEMSRFLLYTIEQFGRRLSLKNTYNMVESGKRILLITGTPGCGKTTLLSKIAQKFDSKVKIGGFLSFEVREGGTREGFKLSSFAGSESIFAHIDYPKKFRVGKYGVNVEDLDEFSQELAAEQDVGLYIIDEIGKMETFSKAFVETMRNIFASGVPVIASISLKGTPLINTFKEDPHAEVWEINERTRNQYVDTVETWLDEKLAS
mmetsp:Transcript_17308/g.19509  ORF Transcript_17308/g.19509 Transcript_17308/m.19509 type:complete len:205 (-) Transcript_17308:469-1083(-)